MSYDRHIIGLNMFRALIDVYNCIYIYLLFFLNLNILHYISRYMFFNNIFNSINFFRILVQIYSLKYATWVTQAQVKCYVKRLL